MSESMKSYEAVFLVDSGNSDFNAASEPVRTILERYSATILAIKPWEDRRLAYEIRGRKRGLYILVYFQADPLKIVQIEHDCQLDERVIRVLVLKREEISEAELKAETPATAAPRLEPVEGAPAEGAPAAAAPGIEEVPGEEIPAGSELDKEQM